LIPFHLPFQLVDASLNVIKGFDPIIATAMGVVWVFKNDKESASVISIVFSMATKV